MDDKVNPRGIVVPVPNGKDTIPRETSYCPNYARINEPRKIRPPLQETLTENAGLKQIENNAKGSTNGKLINQRNTVDVFGIIRPFARINWRMLLAIIRGQSKCRIRVPLIHLLFSVGLHWTLFSLNVSNEKPKNNHVYHELPFKLSVFVCLFEAFIALYIILFFVLYSHFLNETTNC